MSDIESPDDAFIRIAHAVGGDLPAYTLLAALHDEGIILIKADPESPGLYIVGSAT